MKNEKELRNYFKKMGFTNAQIEHEVYAFDVIFGDFINCRPIEWGDAAPYYAALAEVLKNSDGCYDDYDWGGKNQIAWTPDGRVCILID